MIIIGAESNGNNKGAALWNGPPISDCLYEEKRMKPKNAVIQNVCDCLKEMGLPIIDPFLANPEYAVGTIFLSQGVQMMVQIYHEPQRDMLFFEIYFPAKLTRDRKNGVYEIMNEFNSKSVIGHFAINDFSNKMTFRFGYCLQEESFNKSKFNEIFHQMIVGARENYPLLHKLISEEIVKT